MNDCSGNGWSILCGDVIERLRELPAGHFHCCVTSPPYYGLRDYGVDGQIGLEKSLGEYIEKMVDVFGEVWRVMRDDATVWINCGDSYAGGATGRGDSKNLIDGKPVTAKHNGERLTRPLSSGLKPKDLLGQPWRLAFALQDRGWYLRQEIIWHKPAPMPESVRDRCTKAHEYIFLLTKRPRYFYDSEAVKTPSSTAGRIGGFTGYQAIGANVTPSGNQIAENGRAYVRPFTTNLRSVWTLSPEPFAQAHFATFPSELPRRCILAGTSEHGCCAECGVPWGRVVEKSRSYGDWTDKRKQLTVGATRNTALKGDDFANGYEPPRTIGWQPSCQCSAAIVPCRVLDPFSGAGTTVMVARRLHRHAVGIELNPAYVEMSRKRILEDAPLFN